MKKAKTETKILVIDDQAMIREGLRNLFLSQAGIRVVGEESNTGMAVQFAAKLQPDILIIGKAFGGGARTDRSRCQPSTQKARRPDVGAVAFVG